MRAFVAAFVVAALVGIILTPIVRALALRLQVVDRPGGRHVHCQAIPRLGGVAICLSFLVPLVSLFYAESVVAATFRAESKRGWGLIAGALLMSALGLIDDTRGLRAIYKLAIQIVIAGIAFGCGYRIDAIDLPLLGTLQMGVFALPVTVFWIVGIVNAVNLIDGLDGLAGGVVFFAALTNLVVAVLSGNSFVAIIMASTMGAVLAFLFYNFNPARIFMGDSGSYFLGFVLATSSLMGASQKASTTVSLLVPMVALGVPIFDTLFAMVRRFLERRSIFSPDRGHVHHRLLDMGITHRRAVLILYGVSILFAAAAIAMSLGRNWEVGVAILIASVAMIGMVRFVGRFEYTLLRTRQKARIRSYHSEVLRRLLPGVRARFTATQNEAELLEALEQLGRDAKLDAIEVVAPGPKTAEIRFVWTRDPSGQRPRDSVSARYPLHGAPPFDVKFVWQSEFGEVSPQVDILLQIIADVLQSELRRVGSSLVPATEPVRESRPSFTAVTATHAEP